MRKFVDCSNKRSHGYTPFAQGVAKSCNPLAVFLVTGLWPFVVFAQGEPSADGDPSGVEGPGAEQDSPRRPPSAPGEEPPPVSENPQQQEALSVMPFDVQATAPDGRPVAGATVEIPALGISAKTGRDGYARLEAPIGSYEFTVTAEGFAAQRESLLFDAALSQAGISVFLTYDIGEVVVTGATTDRLVSESPVRTLVVDKDSIERGGAVSLAQALRHTTGVRVENDCQSCNFTQVRLNGMDGRYSQILINGRPVFSTLAGVYGLEQIPAEMIDRIEIVKGGGSAIYGGGAVAGAINVITKRPDRNFGSVRFGGFTLGSQWGGRTFGGNMGLVNDSKNLALTLTGSLSNRQAWDANGDGFSDVGWYKQYAVGSTLYWDPVPRGTLTLSFQEIGESRRGGDSLDLPEYEAATAESTRISRQSGELRWRHSLRSGVSYELGYAFAFTNRESYYGGGEVVVPGAGASTADWENFWDAKSQRLGEFGRTSNPMHFGDVLVNVPYEFLGEMMLSAGVQLQIEQLKDSFPAYSRTTDATYSDIAGLLELDWYPVEWSEAIVGVRVGKNSGIEQLVVTPRAAVTFTPTFWLRTRSSFSTGYRAPQVFDEDLHVTVVGGEGVMVSNAPGLDPEISYSGAQQVEMTFSLSSTWSLKTGLNGFVTYLTNSFVLEDVDDPATVGEREFQRDNLGSTLVYGGELEASLAYRDSFLFRAGWVLERATRSDPDPNFNSKDFFRTPHAYGFAEISGKLPGGIEPMTALDVTGPMKVPHYSGYIANDVLHNSPWFIDWDLGLSYRLPVNKGPRMKFSVIGRNLLNSFQNDLDRGALRDAGYVYGPSLPRSIWFEVKGEM